MVQDVPADDVTDESLARNLNDTRLSSTRPSVSSSEKPKATRMGPTRPETTQGSPPRGLLVSPGESYLNPEESPGE